MKNLLKILFVLLILFVAILSNAQIVMKGTFAGNFVGNGVQMTNVNTTVFGTNTMLGSGTLNPTNNVNICSTNVSFTLTDPAIPFAVNGGVGTIVVFFNTSGSPITVTPAANWHVAPNSNLVITNESIGSYFKIPGVTTNWVMTPIY